MKKSRSPSLAASPAQACLRPHKPANGENSLINTLHPPSNLIAAYLFYSRQISAIEGRVSWRTIFLNDEETGEGSG